LIIQIDTNQLFNLFKADSFNILELKINEQPPSFVEYYLSEFLKDKKEDQVYLNKSNVQNSFCFNNFNFFLDYDNNLFIENTNIYTNGDEPTLFL